MLSFITCWIAGAYPLGFFSGPGEKKAAAESEKHTDFVSGMAESVAVETVRGDVPAGLPTDPESLRGQLKGKYMAVGYPQPSAPRYYWVDVDVTADNKVSVTNLMEFGTTVTGTFNPSTRVISIPRQVIVKHENYGDLYILPCDLDKKVYYVNDSVRFEMGPDGSLTTDHWGAFVMEGENKGKALAHYGDVLYPAKATMTDYSLSKPEESRVNSYPVVFVRESRNRILIKNFYNHHEDMVLTVDSVGGVVAQYLKVMVQVSPTGKTTNFFNWTATDTLSIDKCKLNSKGVPGKYEGRKITLNRWVVSAGTAVSSRYDLLEKSVIEVPEEFVPFSNAITMEGKGTAEEPYLVKSADDLCELSSACNYEPGYVNGKMALKGIHFRQTADIDMKEVANFEPIGFSGTTAPFCGVYDGGGHVIRNLYVNRRNQDDAGLFGKIGKPGAVRNLRIEKALIKSDTKNRLGAVAGSSEGIIENVKVTDTELKGGNLHVGGIVGNFKGYLRNSSFEGKVSGKNMIGGLVGVGWGQISDCDSRAEIVTMNTTCNAGGIAGSLTGDSVKVRNVTASGSVFDQYGSGIIGGLFGLFQYGRLQGGVFTGQVYSVAPAGKTSTASVGGIAGAMCASKISDCLMAGTVTSPDAKDIAGLVGKINKRPSGTDEPRIESSIVTGPLACKVDYKNKEFLSSSAITKHVVSGNYYDSQTFGHVTESPKGELTGRLVDGEPIDSISAGAWTYRKGSYPVPSGLVNSEGGKLAASAFVLGEKDNVKAVRNDFTLDQSGGTEWKVLENGRFSDRGHGLRIEGGRAILTADSVVSDTLVARRPDGRYKMAFLKILPTEYEGEGTEASPYLIRSVRDILKLQNAVDVQGVRYDNTYFRMENDLDFSGVEDFIGISSNGVDRAFNGIFDGNGHSIKNWKIDRVGLDDRHRPTKPDASTRMAGFFLFTGRQSVIRNLTMDRSCTVIAGSHVSALVSQNYGRIENCRNYATVLGIGSQTGGLVAVNYDTGLILKSYNGGEVKCGGSVSGGIAAANIGEINACMNGGSMTNDRFSTESPEMAKMGAVGGIAGYNFGKIGNVINYGTVTAPLSAGGLIGENKEGAHVEKSLSAGVCTETRSIQKHGAVIGYQKNLGDSLENVYSDFQITSMYDGNNGSLAGVGHKTTAELTSGELPEGLDGEEFSAASGRYPMIKGYENVPEAVFMASTLIRFGDGERKDSRFNMRGDAALVMPAGARAVTATTDMTVSEGRLSLKAGASEVCDTVTFISGGLRKSIPVFAPGRILAEGDGSVQTPWLIKTPADWNSVGAFTERNIVDFRDEHFRVAADMDFAGVTLTSWFRSGTSSFQGTLDGAGHTMDNIVVELTSKDESACNVGLIGFAGSESVIKDLTLGNGCRFKGYDYVGSFVARMAGLAENCVNRSGNVESTRVFCGGISSYVLQGARFVGCVNHAPVTAASGQAGGIAGGNGGEFGKEITGCINYGDITSGTATAGGIIGSCRVPVKDCRNEGSIKAKDSSAGGIAGYQASGFPIENCENHGDVNAGAGAAGGMAGTVSVASVVRNSRNYGNVESGRQYAGGMIGRTIEAGSSADGCANFGKVTSKGEFAGGIVGECEAGFTAMNVRNTGDVSAEVYAGGIAGGLKGTISKAVNTGVITVGNRFAGGICGVLTTGAGNNPVKDVLNSGDVRGTGTTKDNNCCLGGILGGGSIALENGCNMADVSGYRFVGGLVGLAENGSTLENSYTVGDVLCHDVSQYSTCGNVTGKFNAGKISNVYFDTQHGSLSRYDSDAQYAGKLTREMNTAALGAGFVRPAHQGYPVLKVFEADSVMKVCSSAVVLDDTQTRHSVTKEFSLVSDSDVEWKSDYFTIENGKASLGNLGSGVYTIEASHGGVRKEFRLKVDADGTGITETDGREPVETRWYSIDGKRLRKPAEGVCVKVSIYEDGTRKSEKTMQAR